MESTVDIFKGPLSTYLWGHLPEGWQRTFWRVRVKSTLSASRMELQGYL